MVEDFLIFLFVGFLAQLVDGALGMAYGVTATTVLLSFGVPPAHASAATHAAEVFTTGASGGSHVAHRNVDWRLFWRLAPAGMAGGALGVFVLTSFDGKALRPFIFTYLGLMGVYILWRMWRPLVEAASPPRALAPLGLAGGFLDATGGGGWGPIVTTTLLGAGQKPRFTIGTVNAVEFLVAVTISASFVIALLTGHWDDAGDLLNHAPAVVGLVAGGVLAAPLAGFIVKIVPPRALGLTVGLLIISLSLWQLAVWVRQP
ncbi:MAG: sulfite exporter TauE/SafE family protein [Beijerinckiaceae bacterium]